VAVAAAASGLPGQLQCRRGARGGFHRPPIRGHHFSLGPRLVRSFSDQEQRTGSSAARGNDRG
jgi:hypothetical protein